MKKLLLLLVAAVAMSAPAGNITLDKQALPHPERTVSQAAAVGAQSVNVITEQPEGEMVMYHRNGECIYRIASAITAIGNQMGIIKIVYGEDGKVYFNDPVYGMSTDAWVEGTISDDGTTITMPLDQYLQWNEEENYGLVLKVATIDISADNKLTLNVDEDVTEVTFTVTGNAIKMNDTYGDRYAELPTQMRGLCAVWSDDMSFSGYISWNTVFVKLDLTPVVPADPSLDPADTGVSEAWIDGGNEDGTSQFHHKFKYRDVDGNPIERAFMSYSIFTDDDQLFTFDAETYGLDEDMTEIPLEFTTSKLGPTTTWFYRTNYEGYERFFERRIGIQVYYTVSGVKNASNIVYYDLPEYTYSGVPANPTADEWLDCGSEIGLSMFLFNISEYTTDGGHMDPACIYYSIFTDDDQLFTFDAETYYKDFTEDVTLVPYTYWGDRLGPGVISFFRTNAEGYEPFFNHQIGVQVYFKQQDGSMTASDIVYLEVFPPATGVDEANAGKTVADVKYFNMAGQQMSQPSGICIAVTTYTDGTTAAFKVVK